MSYVHIFLRLPNYFYGKCYEKSIVWKYFFHNRQIPWSYFRENDNIKICFETPQKIEQLTTLLGRLLIFNENMLRKSLPLRFW